MNKIKFDREAAKFDRYGRMHISDSYFTRFESGEVIYHGSFPSADYRGHSQLFGVRIFSQNDFRAPRMATPEGVPVPTAWFGSTQVFMVADEETKVVKKLGGIENKELPLIAQRAACYWAGPGATPMTGHTLRLTPPNKWTKEEKEFALEVASMSSAVRKLERGEYDVDMTPEERQNILFRRGISISDYRGAIAEGMSPIEFARKCTSSLLEQVAGSPQGVIGRETVEHTHLVLA